MDANSAGGLIIGLLCLLFLGELIRPRKKPVSGRKVTLV